MKHFIFESPQGAQMDILAGTLFKKAIALINNVNSGLLRD